MRAAYDISKSWEHNYIYGPFFSTKQVELPKPKWNFLGKKLVSPLGIAAGPLPNANWILAYAKLGYGSLTYKTVRSAAHPSHPAPNVLPVDVKGTIDPDLEKPIKVLKSIPALENLSITNSFGNPSPDPSVWMEEIRRIKREINPGQMLPVSVYGTNHEGMTLQQLSDDYAVAAKLAKQAGADAIEINLSCPNVLGDEDPNIYCSPTATGAITKTVKKAIGSSPLILKVGAYPSKEVLYKVLDEIKGKFEAISAINTIAKKVYDDKGNPALLGREQSGVCGASIHEHGLRMTRMLKSAQKELNMKFEIIGVGGVMKPEHVVEYLDAGANHVQCATAIMWNPNLNVEVMEFLKKKRK